LPFGSDRCSADLDPLSMISQQHAASGANQAPKLSAQQVCGEQIHELQARRRRWCGALGMPPAVRARAAETARELLLWPALTLCWPVVIIALPEAASLSPP
jgi:hypothetical protein